LGDSVAKSISAADANRKFSAVLRDVRDGDSYIVTSHGRPVARIVPFRPGDRVGSAARASLFTRLTNAPVRSIGRWTRDELHER
jgi:prevent-host-death family protein